MAATPKDAIKVEVGDTVLLGPQRIRATVSNCDPTDALVRVKIHGIDGLNWFSVSDVVEVIKPPKPMPEFQEGDMVRFRGNSALYRVIDLQAQYNNMIEIWRLTAPNTLTKIWERKP
jgi:hypothetical protein